MGDWGAADMLAGAEAMARKVDEAEFLYTRRLEASKVGNACDDCLINGCQDEDVRECQRHGCWYAPDPKVTVTSDDPINNPAHYTAGPIECYDAIRSAAHGWPSWAAPGLANVTKYTWRAFKKGKALRDLRKAMWYLEQTIADLLAKGYTEE